MLKKPEDVAEVSAQVLAAVLGITSSALRGLTARGVLERLPGKQGRYDLTAAVPRYLDYKIGGKLESKRAKLVEEQERKLRLQNDRAAGELISVRDASEIFRDFGYAIRAGLAAFPGRLANQLAAKSKPAQVRTLLRDEVDRVLEHAYAAVGDLAEGDEQAEKVPARRTAATKARAKKVSRRVGGRKQSIAKRKRGTRSLAK